MSATRQPAPIESGAPERCPACGRELRAGTSYRHSVGPGPVAAVARRLTAPLAVGAALAVYVEGNGGYGGGSLAVFAAVVVGLGAARLSEALPKARRLRCRACGWRTRIACDRHGRPVAGRR